MWNKRNKRGRAHVMESPVNARRSSVAARGAASEGAVASREVLQAVPSASFASVGESSEAGRARPPVNPVILALVLALRDVEQWRGRGKVLTHVTSKRPAA